MTSNVNLAVLPDDTVTDRLATSVVAAGPKETVGLNVSETGSRSSTSTVAEQLASPASDSAITHTVFKDCARITYAVKENLGSLTLEIVAKRDILVPETKWCRSRVRKTCLNRFRGLDL